MIPPNGTYFSGYLPDPKTPPAPYAAFATIKPKLLATVPAASEVADEHRIPEAVPCFDQLSMASCVANAWCGLLEILLGIEHKAVTPLSRLFLYYLCRKQDGTVARDTGSRPSLAADRLVKIGCVSETRWPYDPRYLAEAPPGNVLDLYSEADDNTIAGAYRLDNAATRGDDIEACILRDHPVVIAVQMSYPLVDATPEEVVSAPAPGAGIGGHCMLVTGRRKLRNGARQWRVRNSWGPDYCDQGHVWLDEPYVLSSADTWTGTRMEALLA